MARSSKIPIQIDHNNTNCNSIDKELDFDKLLLVSEFICLTSSAVVAIGYALDYTFLLSQKAISGLLGNKVYLVWQVAVFVCGIVIGAWLRRRQWRRVSWNRGAEGIGVMGGSIDFAARVAKLEEDVRSSTTMIRVLSRQLEKLGIRFRVTRKNLKEPIAETAALAQKNSEVTRVLAMKEDNLEKELGEIQKVLLAMQEQQQKQLELIVAIGKGGNLWDKQGLNQKQDIKTSNSAVKEKAAIPIRNDQMHTILSHKEPTIDKSQRT